MAQPRILSGIQPTGNLHLGNYLGALRNWVRMQDSYDCFFCIVDLHALTVPQDPAELVRQTRETAAAYIAAGIDPENATLFVQSSVPAHSELSWLLSCHLPLGWLNRMTQFKEKAGKKRELANLGLYAYPALMAADILVYRATHVPVGEDQKQHLELARNVAEAFNQYYEREHFIQPEPQILGAATRVMSLRDGTAKMSKSDSSDYARLNMTDEAETIRQKVRKAKTDPEPLPSEPAGLDGRPEASNLATIYAALAEQEIETVLAEFGGASFGRFKQALSDLAVARLGPIGSEMQRLMVDPAALDRILARGTERARSVADPILAETQALMGLWRG